MQQILSRSERMTEKGFFTRAGIFARRLRLTPKGGSPEDPELARLLCAIMTVMDEIIRAAQDSDVSVMVELSEQKRLELQTYQPFFWRKAANSRARHIPWLKKLVSREDVITLVHEEDGAVDGFIIADFVPAPPVYDVPGPTTRVDDFCVAQNKDWAGIGRALLEAVMREARRRGSAQIVVVCAHLDRPKREMLIQAGLSLASEWYVKPL